jgi:hypothetical protein
MAATPCPLCGSSMKFLDWTHSLYYCLNKECDGHKMVLQRKCNTFIRLHPLEE